jgi:hypothetical protein
MSNSFVSRFKNKSTTVSINGELQVNPERAILRPNEFQLHSSIINSANFILKGSSGSVSNQISAIHSSNPSNLENFIEQDHAQVKSSMLPLKLSSPKLEKRKKNASTTPIIAKNDLANEVPAKGINKSYERKRKEFTPYTIRDYYSIKPHDYYQLGGLGPVNVGTFEWLQKKQLNDKRIKYGKNVYYINAAKLPLLPINNLKDSEKETSARSRALNFARTIQKPPLRMSLSPS